MKKIFTLVLFIFVFISCNPKKENIKVQKYHKGFRYDKNGWIYLHIEGEPYERGFQHGYLIAKEYKDAFSCYNDMMYQISGIKMDYIIGIVSKMPKNKIPLEYLEEMKGIAAGVLARGYQTSLDEIIAWNTFLDLFDSFWPIDKPNYLSKKEKCSAFVATGSATKDQKITMAHSTFDDFWNVQYCNLILDIKPDKGYSILMQSTPGYLASMTDFFIMSSGLAGLETNISGFNGYDPKGTFSFIRQRNAMQYSSTIDEFVTNLKKDNNGGNAAIWLMADANTNEIARFEQGLKFQNFQKKKDGYFFGCNVADDPKIRNLECDNQGYNDIRRHTGGRRIRLDELLNKYFGKIDIEKAKNILSDHYDVYLEKIKPGANTICAHYDNDPRLSMSSTSAVHPDPYTPAGAIDQKVTNSDMIKQMKMEAIFGRACGREFDKVQFLKKHPQWKWQEKYLMGRPRQKWTFFSSYFK